MHGYELMKELRSCLSQSISASHVYPFLQNLRKNKLIDVESEGKRDKKRYVLTKSGKLFVQQLTDKFSLIMDATIQKKVKK